MKKFFIAWSLIISNSLFGANCDNLLKEADKYLNRVALWYWWNVEIIVWFS